MPDPNNNIFDFHAREWSEEDHTELMGHERPVSQHEAFLANNSQHLTPVDLATVMIDTATAEMENLTLADKDLPRYSTAESKARRAYTEAAEAYKAAVSVEEPGYREGMLAARAGRLFGQTAKLHEMPIEKAIFEEDNPSRRLKIILEAPHIETPQAIKDLVSEVLASLDYKTKDTRPLEERVTKVTQPLEKKIAIARLAGQAIDVQDRYQGLHIVDKQYAITIIRAVLDSDKIPLNTRTSLAMDLSHHLETRYVEDMIKAALSAPEDETEGKRGLQLAKGTVSLAQKATIASRANRMGDAGQFINEDIATFTLLDALTSGKVDPASEASLMIGGVESGRVSNEEAAPVITEQLETAHISSYIKAETALKAIQVIGVKKTLNFVTDALTNGGWDSAFRSRLVLLTSEALLETKKDDDLAWLEDRAA